MKRRTTWAAMAAATLLLLSACGNGSDDGATDDGAAENGAAEDTAGDDGGERPDSLVLGPSCTFALVSRFFGDLVDDFGGFRGDVGGEFVGLSAGADERGPDWAQGGDDLLQRQPGGGLHVAGQG